MRNDMIQGSASAKAQAPTRRRAAGGPRKGVPGIAMAIALAAVLAVGGTIAWLTDRTDEVTNVFNPAGVPITVVEEFDGETKSDVRIQNEGNVDAYIRAYVAINWADAEGNIVPEVPEGYGYTPSNPFADAADWAQGSDGYWYHRAPVAPGGLTGVLIDEIAQQKSGAEYFLQVDIVAQSIQVDGEDEYGNRPIELAWGVDIQEDELVDATIETA